MALLPQLIARLGVQGREALGAHQVAVPQGLVHVGLQRLHLELHFAHRLVLLLLQLVQRLQCLRALGRAWKGEPPCLRGGAAWASRYRWLDRTLVYLVAEKMSSNFFLSTDPSSNGQLLSS